MNDSKDHQDQIQPPRKFLLPGVALEGGMAVLAVGLGWLLGHPPLDSVQWTLTAVLWGAVASLPPLMVVIPCLHYPVGPLAELARIIDQLVVPIFKPCNLIDLGVISVLAGLGEEMLFRGVIQASVAGAVGGRWGTWVGLAAAALLFGLAHWLTSIYALMAGLIGLYLGWLWIDTGNLLVPITAHAVYDFLAIIYLVRIRGQASEEEA